MEDIYVDVWAHAFIDNPKLKEEFVTDDDQFAADLAEMEAEAMKLEAKLDAGKPPVKVLGEEDWQEI